MPVRRLPSALLLVTSLTLPALATQAPAQEKGLWRAASKTASSVTGDIAFGDEKLSINFITFTAAELISITPAQIAAAFNTPDATGTGHIFRVSIPADRKFLHKTTLCGNEETQYLVSWVHGHTLQLAFFSGARMPTLTPEAMANTTDLCGTYTYVR